MSLISANVDQVRWIKRTLNEATRRPRSSDFLDRFPWSTVRWYVRNEIEPAEIERLFLFWDGSAWGESPAVPPRTLGQGVEDSRQLILAHQATWPDHLVRIKERTAGYELPADPFLILVDSGQEGSPLMILDGNHRAAAAFRLAVDEQDDSFLPDSAFLGRCPEMSEYPFYGRIQSLPA